MNIIVHYYINKILKTVTGRAYFQGIASEDHDSKCPRGFGHYSLKNQ